MKNRRFRRTTTPGEEAAFNRDTYHISRLPGTDVVGDEHVAHGHRGLLAHWGLGQGPRKRKRYQQRRIRVLHLSTRKSGSEEGGEGACLFVARLSHFTHDHASLSRRSTFPTLARETSNSSVLNALFPYISPNIGGWGVYRGYEQFRGLLGA